MLLIQPVDSAAQMKINVPVTLFLSLEIPIDAGANVKMARKNNDPECGRQLRDSSCVN